MKKIMLIICFVIFPQMSMAARAPVSEATEECLRCHSSLHPGIVEEWAKSRHALLTPNQAMEIKGLALKLSAENVPDKLKYTSVGCAECHTLSPKTHADTFEHNGARVHVVVTPKDCAVCHTQEADQYSRNIMASARKNLAANPLYMDLQRNIIGQPVQEENALHFKPADAKTREDACFYCHGTRVEVKGTKTRETDMGEMTFPQLSGWPNQGVGRVNPDSSLGTCAACHTRHRFSIEMARKPHTCQECHVGPDVPAYKIFMSSKHGNIYSTHKNEWNFTRVPWRVGKDFKAPACAACHISLLVNTDGETVAQRTHEMSGRLPWRIFGLIYAHPHPRHPDTTRIRNKDGLPLPTDFEGNIASAYLIDRPEQEKRTRAMQSVCLGCHSQTWVKGHWNRFEHTIDETNSSVLMGTRIMREIWTYGFAKGPNHDQSLFDEAVEKTWCDTWLFYANTVRFASAMGGGGDFGVFADGRYHLSRRIQELHDWFDLRLKLFPPATPVASIQKSE